MPLDSRRTVVRGECDGGVEQGASNAGWPVPALHDDAGYAPAAGVIARQGLGDGPVLEDDGKTMPWPYPGPANRAAHSVGDESRRYYSVVDLLVQRTAVVW